MPVDHDQRFAEWLATPPQTGRLVEGIYIYGNPHFGAMRFARGIYDAAQLPDEHGDIWTWAPTSFDVDLPEQRSSLQVEMTLVFKGLTPDLIEQFDSAPPESMFTITTLRLYHWIVPGAMDAPMILPPPRFVIEEATISSRSLELKCSGPLLPNWRAGRAYRIEDFPGLSTE